MYLQRLEDAKSSHLNWPTDCGHNKQTLDRYLAMVDDTLNSWSEAHTLFDRVQGDNPEPRAVAHRSFTRLVDQVIRNSDGWDRLAVYPTEVLAHALLKVWIAARQEELKNAEGAHHA